MSKRIILSATLALGLALSLSTSAFAKMEDKDVYFGGSAKEASAEFVQMRVRGTLTEMPSTTAPTTLAITSGGKSYLVDVNTNTKIYRRYWGKSILTEFALGDDLEVWGNPTDSGAIKAKIIRNHTIYLTNTKGVFGNIKSIDLAGNTFIFTWKGKDYNINVDANTKIIIPGIKAKAAPADLKVGDRAQGRAAYNSLTQTYLAKNIVVVRRDKVDLLKKAAKTINKEGRLSKIEGTTLPTVLGITKDGKTYKINVTSKTVIMRKHFGKSSLSEFKVGDKIRVIGKYNADTMTIDAKVLKNDSLKSLNELKVDTDQDGIADARDAKLNDHDNDGTIDLEDADDDNDGIADKNDKKKYDHDNDGTKDAKDNDDDNDGVPDSSEAAGKQFDHDNDGSEDMKDTDDDEDDILDVDELSKAWDHDNDGLNDLKDSDDDEDGIKDGDEDEDKKWDHDNDSSKDKDDDDDDNDGLKDNDEDEGEELDHDNDGSKDDEDDDDDNDSVKDDEDEKPNDSDNDGTDDKDEQDEQ